MIDVLLPVTGASYLVLILLLWPWATTAAVRSVSNGL